MKRLVGSIVALATLAAATAATAGSAPATRLIEAGGARFPDRSYVLTLPTGARLSAANVHVTENGRAVNNLSVVPASDAARGQFGVVMVIDASDSMRGKPITAAAIAARAFAMHLGVNQQLAVVTFNSTPRTLLPFTSDPNEIRAALESPPALAYGTHIYDGVRRALDLVRDAKIASGSIIVLSDGSDTGSAARPDEIAAAARAAHVRIFTVGLHSRAFTPVALRDLATAAGGEFSEARSTADLAPIYDALGSQLSREYLIRYRSLAGPNVRVHVVVTIDGMSAKQVTGYRTPALPGKPLPPFHPSFAYTFWRSPLSMVLVSFATAGLLGTFLILLFRPRQRTLRKRMAQFVSLRLEELEKRGGLGDVVYRRAERSLEKAAWWDRFKEELDVAEIRLPAVQVVVWTAVCTLVAIWLLSAIGGSVIFGVIGLGLPLGVRSLIKKKLSRRRRAFGEQLPDNLQMLASALRAGHSFISGLSVVVEDATEPARSEFRRVIADEQLGVPLEDALQVVVRRMDNNDFEQIALVAALHRETGGNTAEVLDRVNEVVRARMELRDKVRVLTAQGRLSRWVVTILPIGLAVMLNLLNPGYMQPLFDHTSGRIALGFAAVMVTAGSLVIKRIVEIKI
jgi:tight adherence protein B